MALRHVFHARALRVLQLTAAHWGRRPLAWNAAA
jgi:hypothetical protein